MPYAPGVQDISGQLRAQGVRSLGQSVGQGLREGLMTYEQNKIRNRILQGENDALLKAFLSDPETAKYAPEGVEKFVEKTQKGGGLTLKENIQLNGMLNTAIKTKGVIQQQKMLGMQQQAAQAELDKFRQQQAQQQQLNATLDRFAKLSAPGAQMTPQDAAWLQRTASNPFIAQAAAMRQALGSPPSPDAALQSRDQMVKLQASMMAPPDLTPAQKDAEAIIAAEVQAGKLKPEEVPARRAALIGAGGRMPEDRIPSGYERAPDGSVRPIPGSEAAQKAEATAKAAQNKAKQQIDRADRVIMIIDEVVPKIGLTTAGMGSLAAKIPTTEARNVRAQLDAIRANIGFEELQKMREASPTGGALGQVAIQELNFLQSVLGNLDQGQSPEQLRQTLRTIRRSYERWKQAAQGQNPDELIDSILKKYE